MDDISFEDELRFAIHDVLAHCQKTRAAFAEAAKAVGVTPEQALSSLLAKVVIEIISKRQPPGLSSN